MIPLVKQGSAPELPTEIGAPYHGVIIAGVLDKTGDGGPVLTGLANTSSAWNVSLSNPNRTLPTRTGGQITADAAVGREYRDYALAPARKLFGKHDITSQQSVYFDSQGYTWLLTWDLILDINDDEITGDVTATRLFHIGDLAGPATINETITPFTPAGQVGSPDVGLALFFIFDQWRDGSKVLLGNSLGLSTRGIWEATITDTITETGGAYPYGGATIALNIALSVVKTRAEIFGTITFTAVTDQTVVLGNGTLVASGDVATTCSNMGGSGSNYCYLDDGPNSAVGRFSDLIFFASYNLSGTIVIWSADVEVSRAANYVLTPKGAGDVVTQTATEEFIWTLALKRAGTQVDTVTMTATRSYIGTFDEVTTVSTVDSTIVAALAGLTDITGNWTVTRNNVNDAGVININNNPSLWAGNVLEGARRVDILGEPPEDQMPVFGTTTPSWLHLSGVLPELDPALDEHQAFQVAIRNYGGNKAFELVRYVATFNADITGVNRLSHDGVKLGDFFSPGGTTTPDTVERAPASTDWGTPAVYDPETGAWSVAGWNSGLSRWERRGFV